MAYPSKYHLAKYVHFDVELNLGLSKNKKGQPIEFISRPFLSFHKPLMMSL